MEIFILFYCNFSNLNYLQHFNILKLGLNQQTDLKNTGIGKLKFEAIDQFI